jgi:hypothetical protein
LGGIGCSADNAARAVGDPGSASGSNGVVNVSVLDDKDSLSASAEPMVFDGENVEDRNARQARGWTPVRVSVSPWERMKGKAT